MLYYLRAFYVHLVTYSAVNKVGKVVVKILTSV